MLLIHGRVSAIQHVVDKLFPIRQRRILAIDIARAFLIDLEKKTPKISSCDVDVLANFEITVRAQHKESPVSPGRETVRSKPVDADVTCPVISSQHHIAKILYARIL